MERAVEKNKIGYNVVNKMVKSVHKVVAHSNTLRTLTHTSAITF
jgi:hypothetical protein